MEDFQKVRLEKDLAELKKLIDTHFAQVCYGQGLIVRPVGPCAWEPSGPLVLGYVLESNFKHFFQRKKDEEELEVLKSQIDKRKDVRAKQIEERARKQQEKLEREKVRFHHKNSTFWKTWS